MDENVIQGIANGTSTVISLVLYVVLVIALWKIFVKAGEEGWKSIIPLYNMYILYKIAWGKGLLFLLIFVPIVNIVVHCMMNWKLAKAFGYGAGMGIVNILFPSIGQLIIGFGDHGYLGPQ